MEHLQPRGKQVFQYYPIGTRTIYQKANLEDKAKVLSILLSNCELKGVETSFYWNKPFDILFEMGQTEKWGE
jgi:hypothetical protein